MEQWREYGVPVNKFWIISFLATTIILFGIIFTISIYRDKPLGSISINRQEKYVIYSNYVNSSWNVFDYNFIINWGYTEQFIIKGKMLPNLDLKISNIPSNINFHYSNSTGDIIVTINNPHTIDFTLSGVSVNIGRLAPPIPFAINGVPTYYSDVVARASDNEFDLMIKVSSFELLNKTDVKGVRLIAGISNPEWFTLSNVDPYPLTSVGQWTSYTAIWNLNTSLPLQEEHYIFYHVKAHLIGDFFPEILCYLEIGYNDQTYFVGFPTVEGGILSHFGNQGINFIYYPSFKTEN